MISKSLRRSIFWALVAWIGPGTSLAQTTIRSFVPSTVEYAGFGVSAALDADVLFVAGAPDGRGPVPAGAPPISSSGRTTGG